MSNTDGITTFPANPYNSSGEYGPAFNDIRHRVLFGGTINTKWNIRFNPLLTFQTGAPFNITTGSDLYGTTLFNARPGIDADPSKPGLIQTPYGLLDPNPAPGEQILGRNAGRGPFQIQTNLRVTKTWGLGAETSPAATGRFSFQQPRHPAATTSRLECPRGIFLITIIPALSSATSPRRCSTRRTRWRAAPTAEGFSENASNRRLELQLRFTF